MTRKCAYLTMESTEGWSIDADLGFPPLEALGWSVDAVPWRSATPDWDRYDAVYIGVPWDYPEDPHRFLTLLATIEASRAILVNPLALVHWSLAKTYLRDLEQRGADIVPSLWYESLQSGLLQQAFVTHGSEKIIVKPVVSTNATHTYLLTRTRAQELGGELQATFGNRPFVVQPFIGKASSRCSTSIAS